MAKEVKQHPDDHAKDPIHISADAKAKKNLPKDSFQKDIKRRNYSFDRSITNGNTITYYITFNDDNGRSHTFRMEREEDHSFRILSQNLPTYVFQMERELNLMLLENEGQQ